MLTTPYYYRCNRGTDEVTPEEGISLSIHPSNASEQGRVFDLCNSVDSWQDMIGRCIELVNLMDEITSSRNGCLSC